MIPKNIIALRLALFERLPSFNSSKVKNIKFAVSDHLVCNLYEEPRHSFIGIVIPGDSVDHFDAVHQSRKSIFDIFRISFIQGLNKLLKCL